MGMESKDAISNTLYGLVAIDNFTKVTGVVRIRNRTPEAMIAGLKEICI